MRGVFVTGTDTGVGKTFVAGALLGALRRCGCDAVPMKPVQTGCRGRRGALCAPDLDYCLAAAGLRPSSEEKALMAPYRFRPACSPHLAASLAGTGIRVARILAAARRLAAAHGFLVVEGAGGVLVPLGGGVCMGDLMQRLGLPVLLVARPGLGTINHTLLSLEALRQRGLCVAGVIFNHACPDRADVIARDNVETVERLGRVRVMVHPHQSGGMQRPAGRRAMDRLAAVLLNDKE